GTNILRGVYAVTGGTIPGGGPTGGSMHFGTHIANIRMALEPYDIRGFSTTELLNRWRELVGTIPGVDSITFKANLVHMGANIDVQLAHQDPEVLVKAKDRLKRALAAYPGVYNIEDTYAQGKEEFKVRIKAIGKVLGLTEESLGRELRAAFYGAEAVRLQRGRNEIKVMVRFPPSRRKSVYDLETMRIKTPSGGEVPLREVATIIPGRGYSIINRFDRKRVVDVTANVDKKRANAEDILDELRHGILRALEKDYPGLTYTMQGEERERRESMESMMSGFVLALFGIYALLAIVFKSYIQPVIIMLAIPFGIIGAILGHMIMGYNLSILSMFGIVALAGVVVNDSLLLVDRANNERRRGAPALGSLISAGTRRFRPILLTSLTTFFGLTPMILETSVQAQFLIPMAISLGFGILFATFITLLIIPAFYLVVEDLKSIF
ncbi:MAG TPA: efflux RND transporter permease subunit, partial [Dissulfuribacter thermophilus]|nr:efflux RND transporter permease subunit [Dissulfuribacter thermophilus]